MLETDVNPFAMNGLRPITIILYSESREVLSDAARASTHSVPVICALLDPVRIVY